MMPVIRILVSIAWLLLAGSVPAMAGGAGPPAGRITIKHPYEDVDWSVIKQYNFAHHVHARGKPYEAVMDRYSRKGKDAYHALQFDDRLAKSLPSAHPDTSGRSSEHDTEFKRAWGSGKTFWINNYGPGKPPRVTRITVDDGVIGMAVEGNCDAIKWKYGTETIGSGTMAPLNSLTYSS